MSLTHDEREAGRIFRKAKARERKERKAERPANAKASRGREVNTAFLQYLRRQPCEAAHMGGCDGPIQAAHIRFNDGPDRQNPGGQRKNHDRNATPICAHHHLNDQHTGSERAFWERIGKDAYDTAAKHYAAFKEPTND